MTSSALRSMTLLAALSAATAGCAFFGKSEPVVIRYFTPEAMEPRPASPPDAGAREPAAPAADLRIGRVNAASYLKDRIVFRERSFEVGYYETLRWTEKPEAYLRRALGRALFQEHGVRQIISGPGPTLDVDLDAFEELRYPRHAARIQVTWVLHDDQRVQLQRTLTIERLVPSGESGGEGAVASAMAAAFGDAVERVVAGVIGALPTSAPASSDPSSRAELTR